ncbi:MAG: HDIG domain-containing protein, partial [Desulfobacterales bacterium]|nr:HDIG domain-containing protein [Desulfobacterales bacterium]
MPTPSKKQCDALLLEMEMPDHIMAHSSQVRRVALVLVDQLARKGVQLDRDLVEAAAILHDITKLRSFTTGENHAETGGRLLTERGFPEVGAIIRQHVWLDRYPEPDPPGEAGVVNYADKRVRHDEVTTLENRMNYILETYGSSPEYQERLRWLWKRSVELEDRLFSYVSFPPDELIAHL